MRKIFLDYDARREPKTTRYCIKCQRDIKLGQPARVVQVAPGFPPYVLHPEDAGSAGERHLVGMDCAKRIGLEFSVPEALAPS